ncbi:2-dehydropantoate 2-reductase [Fulvivirgaceae bacterium BMA12]|uniref:2-dehydropantoate 2-reductase n=1 Tax=Agaribacillus aureus TaxID=3051825 RepID=A0ABT8KZD9_9BACT|nr:2-dehydropantoate 2-reductase [Fulvivirgaceae bacterium BMA12]
MKIYIIGAGAIGKALAVFLKINGKDVEIIRGSVDDGSSYYEEITLSLKDDSKLKAEIKFNTLINLPVLDGLIILTNKSFGNARLCEKLKGKIHDSPIVILQNGLGVERPFIENGFQDVFRCVLFATSQRISKNEVNYKPVSASPIGVVRQRKFSVEAVVNQIDTPGFGFTAEKLIERIVWKKAIANCVFNSICPLLEVDNGVFHRDKETFSLAKRIIKECVVISKGEGIDLESEEIENQVITISKMSDGQFISTLQDIRNNRETEIDTLNFEIHRIALKKHMENFVLETKLLGDLIKLKSALSR